MNEQAAETRRKRLLEWIEQHHGGSVNAFAKAIGKPQPQIADMLRGAKAFGEKVARDIEVRAKMPKMLLDGLSNGPPMIREKIATYGLEVTLEGVRLGQEWDKLDPEMQAFVQTMVEVLVAKKVKAERPPKGKRASANTERPDA